MLGSGGGSWAAGTHLRLLSRAQRQEQLSGLFGLCCVFPLSVSLLFLLPLFAVLLNCPYPDPPVSACFFPFSSTPRQGEGRLRDAFVDGCSQTLTASCHSFSLNATEPWRAAMLVHEHDWSEGADRY